MKTIKTLLTALAVSLPCVIVNAQDAFVRSDFQLGGQSVALWQPSDKSTATNVGIVVMHSNVDYTDFIANAELAKRGFTVLASTAPASDILTDKVQGVERCVNYLRSLAAINRVVLLGHSGGATVMSAYALLAEQGSKATDNIIYKDYDPDIVNNLAKVDGLMLLDPNYGLSTMMLLSLDPNVIDHSGGMEVVETLNLGDPAVGYNAGGNSVYTADFIKEFGAAQSRRMNRLREIAETRLAEIKAGKAESADDEPMVIAAASQVRFNNKLFPQDTLLLNHTRQPHTLLHDGGIETVEVVKTVRSPMRYRNETDKMASAAHTTVRGYLSAFAIDCNGLEVLSDGVRGVGFKSNINNPIGNVSGVTVPSLFMGMTGSWEFIAAEMAFDNSAARDKVVAFVEGGEHMIRPMDAKYGDTVRTTFDYMAAWLKSHFE